MPQTVHSINMSVGLPGLKYDSGFTDTISRLLEAAAGCRFGVFTQWGTDPETQCDLVATGFAQVDLAGVALYDDSKEPAATASQGYDQNDAVPLIRKGRIWMLAENATINTAPFIRIAAGAGGSVIGAVRNSGDTASAEQIPGGAMFRSTAKTVTLQNGETATIALVELDLAS